MKNNLTKTPIKASVIILNYFGEKVIAKTIDSVLNQDFPSDQYQIIVADNNSLDGSRQIIDQLVKLHPQIKSLYFDKNYGFAGGNNRAIKTTSSKYVILLNNDCIADKKWLSTLIKTAQDSPKMFSVTSKVLIYPKYFLYSFKSSTVIKVCQLVKSHLLDYTSDNNINLKLIRKNNDYSVEIPFDPIFDQNFTLLINSKETSFNLKDISSKSYNKIQNAGSIVFQDGYGRDIGAVVKQQQGDCEIDFGQYETDRQIYSSCGAAVLYNKSILDKIGLFDEDFFLYYEDTELSERANLAGYINYYSHHSVVRHLHALSSKEWSPFFIYHVEKGRLLHTFLHFPFKVFLFEYFEFFKSAILRYFHNLIFDQKHLNKDLQYLKVSLYFLFNIFTLASTKSIYNKHNVNSIDDNYQQLLKGYWLQNV